MNLSFLNKRYVIDYVKYNMSPLWFVDIYLANTAIVSFLLFTFPQNIDDNKHRFAKHNSLKRKKLQTNTNTQRHRNVLTISQQQKKL